MNIIHHIKAAEHLELAAKHHRNAAETCHKEMTCATAEHYTLKAMGHMKRAKKHVKEIIKSYAPCQAEEKCNT